MQRGKNEPQAVHGGQGLLGSSDCQLAYFRHRLLHFLAIDLMYVDRVADAAEHRQRQPAAQVLAELFQAGEQGVAVFERRRGEREASRGWASPYSRQKRLFHLEFWDKS